MNREVWLRRRRADDPAIERGELQLLEEFGMFGLPAVSAQDEEGQWLLEVYVDERSDDLERTEPVARTLAVHCLYGGSPDERSRARAISAAARADTLA